MPLDTSIAMSYKPMQLEDPLEVQAQRQQIQANALAMKSQQAEQNRQNKLAQLFERNPDTTSPEFMSQFRQLDFDKASAYELNRAQLGQTQAATDVSRADLTAKQAAQTRRKRVDTGLAFMNGLSGDASDQHINEVGAQLKTAGYSDEDIAATLQPILALPPKQRKQAIRSQILQTEEGQKALALVLPKIEKIDTGGKIIFRDVNPDSPTANEEFGSIAKTASPDAVMAAASSAARLAQDAAQFKVTTGLRREEIDANKPKEGAAEAAAAAQDQKYKSIKATIAEARALAGPGETGFLGPITSKIGGTKARTLAGKINTIKANLGFEQLQRMREASPTGGALGQVAVKELERLESTVASLDLGLPTSELLNSLAKVDEHYDAWNAAVQKSRTAAPSGGGWGKASVVPGAK